MADRLLTINLRNYLVRQSVRKRPMKISGYVRERVAHYTKTEEENVKLTGDLNILMIKRHARSMLPLKVNVKIENGIATVSPFAMPKKAATATPEAKPAKTEAKAATTTAPKAAEKKAEAKPAKAEKKEPKPAAATK
jgi:hypothetical protein